MDPQLTPEATSQPSKSQQSTPRLQSHTNESPSSPDLVEIDKDDSKLNELGTKRRSEVWNHFDLKKINGAIKAYCRYCLEKLVGDSNFVTSHLKKHYMKKHHKKENIKQKILESNFNKGHPELSSYNFNHEIAKKELAIIIIMHEYPLSMVDHVGFKRYSSTLQPLFKVPCRNTIKKMK